VAVGVVEIRFNQGAEDRGPVGLGCMSKSHISQCSVREAP
jgi:hypothetical protein